MKSLSSSVTPNPGNAAVEPHPTRIQSLDGLRAIAIILVIFNHYIPRVLLASGKGSSLILEASGWAGSGVDLFFVLSGFLITGILIDARGSSNYFRRFYWRRSLRIFPAFYALLLFVLVSWPAIYRGISFPWFALYVRNWIGADRASDGTLGHLWSLAVEEQFYIAWSIAVYLCPRRHLLRLILLLIAAAPLIRAGMHFAGYSGYLIFRVTPARMDGLLSGALVAAAIRANRALDSRLALRAILVSLAGFLLLRLSSGALSIDLPGYQVMMPSLTALLFSSIVFLCLNLHEKNLLYRLLTCSPLRVVAKYSYAIYLWHLVAAAFAAGWLVVLEPQVPILSRWRWHTIAFFSVACGLSFLMAILSWVLLERPALNLKDRFFQLAEAGEPNHGYATDSTQTALSPPRLKR